MAILPRILALVLRKTRRFLMSIFLLQLDAALTTRPFLRPVVQRTFLAIFLPLRAQTSLASTSIFIYYFGRCVITYPSIASKPTIIVAVDVTIILNFSSFAPLNIVLISLRFF
jgi:hypothetical protein